MEKIKTKNKTPSFYSSPEGTMELKKTLGMAKPRTAKSEEKFKEFDRVPSFTSKKSPSTHKPYS